MPEEGFFESLIAGVREAVYGVTADGTVIFWNAAAEALFGFAASEIVGRNNSTIVPAKSRAHVSRAVRATFAGKKVGPFATHRLAKSGSSIYVSLSLAPIKNEAGDTVAVSVIARDITRERHLEQKLYEEQAVRAAILETAMDSIITMDCDGNVVSLNSAAEALFGCAREDAVGLPVADLFIPAGLRQRHREGLANYVSTGQEMILNRRIEVSGQRSDGQIIPIELTVTEISSETRRLFVAHIRDISDRKQSEMHLISAFERERLVNEIGLAIRTSIEPDEIQEIAAGALGRALGADRCYFVLYDMDNVVAHIQNDWHRVDLRSIAGRYSTSILDPMYPVLEAGEVLVIEDARTVPRFPELADIQVYAGMTSSIRVPLLDHGRLAAVLAVTMAERPRAWTPDEISLVEAVAVHVRSALDIARNLIREQRISNTLQSALQPLLPAHLPGLELAAFYRAALDESRIGGDFYDCFLLRNGNYALVIGDLSGKGLSAAAQVATMRNLLRGVLYVVEHVKEAVTTLNTMSLEHGALNGFVSLFVASYNPQTHEFSYVSCGHEPSLLWRSDTGNIDFLNPTGPVLGITMDADYSEGRIRLRAGDRLILYTDGISESGRDRHTLLGPEGLSAILSALPGRLPATELTEGLRAEVEACGGALRDDACLVTAVVV